MSIGKKGNLLDFFLIPVILFIAAITLVTVLILANKINDSGLFSTNDQAEAAFDQSRTTLLNSDNLMLFLIIGLSCFVLVSGYFVWNHPAFYVIGALLLLIAIIVSAVISNTYETFTENGNLEVDEASSSLPKLNFLMGKLPIYIVFMGFITAIVMYIGYTRQYG